MAAAQDPLELYRRKRDFRRTPEPSGGKKRRSRQPVFVVQKHDASTLHYDFRLEVGEVLKSWAIPKGPSTDPAQKRLAMPTEDHPLAYADFEGVIPEGSYGAGTVIVWDAGTYRNLRAEAEGDGASMEQSLREGKVEVWLDGEKLKGGFALVRMGGRGRDQWLLIKKKDEHAAPGRDVTESEPRSVLSGRTLEEVAGGRDDPPEATGKRAAPRGGKRKRGEKPAPGRSSPAAIRVGGRTVEVSNPDKVLFPGAGITERELAEYYHRVADVMLPHLRDRPLSLQRFPEGIDGEGFYQKKVPAYYPEWVGRVEVPVKGTGKTQEQVVCNNAETLVYLADQDCITPHAWLSRADDLAHPDRLIFDLDPTGDEFRDVRDAAKALRAMLEEAGLVPFVTTTGSRGLHVVVPIERGPGFGAVRDFARDLAEVLARHEPDRFTVAVRKNQRRGRLFLDYLRNSYAHTAVPPYAVRAKPGAPVATPLEWDELDRPGMHSQRYTLRNLFQRLARRKDPWAAIDRSARALDGPRKRLDEMRKREGEGT
ncbi:MAG TPA: non-homologous end-joining DNA ligase [Gemmataceae bacterium]